MFTFTSAGHCGTKRRYSTMLTLAYPIGYVLQILKITYLCRQTDFLAILFSVTYSFVSFRFEARTRPHRVV